jgi:hypothetical protein
MQPLVWKKQCAAGHKRERESEQKEAKGTGRIICTEGHKDHKELQSLENEPNARRYVEQTSEQVEAREPDAKPNSRSVFVSFVSFCSNLLCFLP